MGVSPGVVVLLAIIAAASFTALAAAMYRVYSVRGAPSDPENADGMLAGYSNEQTNYMRDVRLRGQLQQWGVAPAFEESQWATRSQLPPPIASTVMSYG